MTAAGVNWPVSDAELRRRVSATREAMERDGIDVLVASNYSEENGGYVRYLTDLPAGGYGTSLVFPRDVEATLITHGALDTDRRLDGDPVLRGIGRVLSSPYFPTAPYTASAPGMLLAKALTGYERAVIGLLGTTQMPLAVGEQLKRDLPDARFVEASDLLDAIKIVKSPEEQELIRSCAQMQDEAMRAALAAVAPGKRESEIANVARHVAFDRGAEAGIIMVGSGRWGGGWTNQQRHFQERVIEDGDTITILVELNGPGGMFAELGRSAVLGPVPTEAEEELALVLEAQRFTLDRLKPGRPYAEIWDEYNEFLRELGREECKRIHCHGQGVDLVERPLVRFDEPMAVTAGTNVACHPSWLHNGGSSWICDNYLIGEDGPGPCLHSTPQEIVQL